MLGASPGVAHADPAAPIGWWSSGEPRPPLSFEMVPGTPDATCTSSESPGPTIWKGQCKLMNRDGTWQLFVTKMGPGHPGVLGVPVEWINDHQIKLFILESWRTYARMDKPPYSKR